MGNAGKEQIISSPFVSQDHQASRRLEANYDAWRAGKISFAEFDASVQGWINHVRYADSWRLREKVLAPFVWGAEAYQE